MSSARRNEIKSAVALATRLSWVFVVIAAAGIALFRPWIYTPGAVLFAAGARRYSQAWCFRPFARGFCIHLGRSRRSWVAWDPALRCRSLSLRQDCATGRTNDTINAGAHP